MYCGKMNELAPWQSIQSFRLSVLAAKLRTQLSRVQSRPGADPTTVSYKASVANFYSAKSDLVHFYKKSSTFKNAIDYVLQRQRCTCVDVNWEVVGLAPGKIGNKRRKVLAKC
jgi:hypothetical protein